MRGTYAVAALALAASLAGLRSEGDDQEFPDAVTADPDHYSVEFENDVVRLVRIRYGIGETSVMHHHPANCSIMLTDASTRMETPGGEIAATFATAGQVNCGYATVHRPSNAGHGPFELILVEFKGRQSPTG